MTRDDVIRMAREAGFHVSVKDALEPEWLRFATLVEAKAAAAEREACAKVCEELLGWNEDDPGSSAAAAIRARGQEQYNWAQHEYDGSWVAEIECNKCGKIVKL